MVNSLAAGLYLLKPKSTAYTASDIPGTIYDGVEAAYFDHETHDDHLTSVLCIKLPGSSFSEKLTINNKRKNGPNQLAIGVPLKQVFHTIAISNIVLGDFAYKGTHHSIQLE